MKDAGPQDKKHVFVEVSILVLYEYKSGVLMYCWGRVSFRTSQIETGSCTFDKNHTSTRSLMSLGAVFRFLSFDPILIIRRSQTAYDGQVCTMLAKW